MRSAGFLATWCVTAAFSCGNRGAPEPVVLTAESAAQNEAAAEEYAPRIYHDLTKYGWYLRAEPLVAAQQQYLPSGAPVAIPLAKLQLAGNYQGVDFYVTPSHKEPPATVYVPVYEGYWLPFTAGRTARN